MYTAYSAEKDGMEVESSCTAVESMMLLQKPFQMTFFSTKIPAYSSGPQNSIANIICKP